MPLSQVDAEKIIGDIQEAFDKTFKARNAKGLADFYHPDAVLIAQGHWVAYGKSEIEKKYEEFVKMGLDFKANFTFSKPAADDEYIIHHGTFEAADKPGETSEYRQIYKRSEGGKHLIYHDIFEMKA